VRHISRRDPLIEIQADNLTFLGDPAKGLAGEHAGPTANIQDPVTTPDSGGVGNRASPGAEDHRDKAGFVDFGGIR
jgi:hypothetical protein